MDYRRKEVVSSILTKAGKAHMDVNQNYGNEPYLAHLSPVTYCVANLLSRMPIPDDTFDGIVFGAAYHDAIEDARMTYNDVVNAGRELGLSYDSATIGAEIAYALTNEKGRTREERANEKYYNGIRTTYAASLVKVCDRICNMIHSSKTGHSMSEKYAREAEHFTKSIDKRCFGIDNDLKEVTDLAIDYIAGKLSLDDKFMVESFYNDGEGNVSTILSKIEEICKTEK